MGPLLLLLAAHTCLAAEPVLATAGVEVGAGMRISHSAMDDPHDLTEGPRATVRVPLDDHGVWVVEAGGFVRTSTVESAGLVRTLVQIAHQGDPDAGFQQPFQYDVWAAQALMDWGLWARRGPHALMGGPRLLAGVEVRQVERVYATYNPAWDTGRAESPVALSEPVGSTAIGAVGGLALDLWFWERVGMRAGWYHRLSWEESLSYDPERPPDGRRLVDRPVFTLDLLCRFGRSQ
ncbi:MAG: hypothetical protein ABIO70_17470 [Pseudomonadota bacterium]